MRTDRPSVTLKQAAEQLSCTRQWVHKLVERGALESFRTTPRKIFIYTDSIEAFINANNSHNQ